MTNITESERAEKDIENGLRIIGGLQDHNYEIKLALLVADLTHQQRNEEFNNMENWLEVSGDGDARVVSINWNWIYKEQMKKAFEYVDESTNPRAEVRHYMSQLPKENDCVCNNQYVWKHEMKWLYIGDRNKKPLHHITLDEL